MDNSIAAFNPLDYPGAFDQPLHADCMGWEEHIPFGMALIDITRPQVLVELGVHSGDSYLAFCQAVSRAGIGTRCYGVDTWQGDAHAGFYGDKVLAALRPKHAPYESFSRLVQATFDEALIELRDEQVDLLHIDGFHAYEAVKRDYETWLPRMSSRGIILFHDVAVLDRGFGVHLLWEELRTLYPSFSFRHGHGLGVLLVGQDLRVEGSREGIARLQRDMADPARAAAITGLYAALGRNLVKGRRAPSPPPARDALDEFRREWGALRSRVATLDKILGR